MRSFFELGEWLAKQANENQAGTMGAKSGMTPRNGGALGGGSMPGGRMFGSAPTAGGLGAAPAMPAPRPAQPPAPALQLPPPPMQQAMKSFQQPGVPQASDPLQRPEPIAARENSDSLAQLPLATDGQPQMGVP